MLEYLTSDQAPGREVKMALRSTGSWYWLPAESLWPLHMYYHQMSTSSLLSAHQPPLSLLPMSSFLSIENVITDTF